MTSPPIPQDGNSIDLDWVRRTFAAGGRLSPPRGVRVEEVGVGSGVMGQVMRCHLDYADDAAPASIIVKSFKHFGDAFSSTTRQLAEAFGLGIVDHMAALGAGPRTFTHGDYRLDNLFFGDDGDDGVTIIDWQVSGLSCGLYDVGYFLAGNLTTSVRRQIERETVEEYHDIVRRSGVTDFTFDECWRLYRQNTLAALLTSVIVCGGLDLDDGRARHLAELGVRRSLAAIEDLDVAEFIPAHGRPWGDRRLIANACRIAYRAYRSYKGV